MTARRQTSLNRDQILEAALRIVDEYGAEKLSMRRLAADLGIEAMSLYHHFPNKNAIIEGVIERCLTAQAPPPSTSAPTDWRQPVLAAVVGFRRALVTHPNVLPLMASHPPVTPSTGAYVQGPLQYLIAHGMPDQQAANLFAAVFSLAFGHAMLTASYGEIQLPGTPPVRFDEESFSKIIALLVEAYESERRG